MLPGRSCSWRRRFCTGSLSASPSPRVHTYTGCWYQLLSIYLSFHSSLYQSSIYLRIYFSFIIYFFYLSFYRSTYLFTYNVRTYTYFLQIIFIFVYQSFFSLSMIRFSSIHHSTYLIVQFLSFDSVRTRKAMMQHLCSRNLSFTLRISDFGPMSRSLEQIQK